MKINKNEIMMHLVLVDLFVQYEIATSETITLLKVAILVLVDLFVQ